jgi:PilZ domain
MRKGTCAPHDHIAPVTPAEPRAFVRYVSRCETAARRRSLKDAGWLARVAKLSTTGVRLLLQHCFSPGSPLVIELQSTSGNLRRHIPATVLHATAVRAHGHQCWLIRCAFLQELSDTDLDRLR